MCGVVIGECKTEIRKKERRKKLRRCVGGAFCGSAIDGRPPPTEGAPGWSGCLKQPDRKFQGPLSSLMTPLNPAASSCAGQNSHCPSERHPEKSECRTCRSVDSDPDSESSRRGQRPYPPEDAPERRSSEPNQDYEMMRCRRKSWG